MCMITSLSQQENLTKIKYTMHDVNRLVMDSLFTKKFGKTLSLHNAADIIYRYSVLFNIPVSKTIRRLANVETNESLDKEG